MGTTSSELEGEVVSAQAEPGKSVDFFGNLEIARPRREPISPAGLAAKRLLDVIGASLALLFLSPLYLILACIIKATSPGPSIYRAVRVGKNGQSFICYKFRTMVSDAEDLKADLLHLNERRGMLFKISNDPRLTVVGGFLRKYSLDELPQFYNVLVGQMSLVGPRPPLVEEYEKYCLEYRRRMLVVPGLTGLWQIRGRLDPSFDNYMALDLQYIDNWHFLRDLEILLRTIPAVFRGTGQ